MVIVTYVNEILYHDSIPLVGRSNPTNSLRFGGYVVDDLAGNWGMIAGLLHFSGRMHFALAMGNIYLWQRPLPKSSLATLSRRDFIKLLGASGLGLAFAVTSLDKLSLLGNSATENKSNSVFRKAFGQSISGQWSGPSTQFNTDIVAIHAALFYNSQSETYRIITVAGSSFNKTYPPGGNGGQPPPGTQFKATVYDPGTGNKTALPNTNPNDLFCCHQAQLPNGDILFAGGTALYDESVDPDNCESQWYGLKKAYRFNAISLQLQAVPDMKEGRWYPTLVCLADGRMAAFSGYDGYGDKNELIEIFNPVSNSWEKAPWGSGAETQYVAGSGTCTGPGAIYNGGNGQSQHGLGPNNEPLGLYPRMCLMPSGLILVAGMENPKRVWNPTGSSIGGVPSGGWQNCSPSNTFSNRYYGNAFLLPLENTTVEKGRVLLVGGGAGGGSQAPVTGVTELLEFTSPTAYNLLDGGDGIPALNHPRKFASQVILPTGKCVVFGGTKGGQGTAADQIYIPEMFDPDNVTDDWITLAQASVPRSYHSVALLLPDGRVWNASGTPNTDGNGKKEVQFYSPWYISPTITRPTITDVPSIGNYDGNITINTPDAMQIALVHGVSLVRLEAVTHHFEPNQRMIWLQFVSRTSGSYTCKAPLNSNLAPPGNYMIHVLNTSGVPSVAKIIKIPGTGTSDQTTPTLTIVSPSAAQVFSGPAGGFSINVVGSANDNTTNGISTVQVIGPDGQPGSINNSSGNWSSWTATVNSGSSSPGTVQRTIKATATDLSGNSSSVTIPITIVFV